MMVETADDAWVFLKKILSLSISLLTVYVPLKKLMCPCFCAFTGLIPTGGNQRSGKRFTFPGIFSCRGCRLNFKKKLQLLNSIVNITVCCDCEPRMAKRLAKNIDIIISTDPVAIDKASFNLVKINVTTFAGSHLFKYAEYIRLGSATHTLNVF